MNLRSIDISLQHIDKINVHRNNKKNDIQTTKRILLKISNMLSDTTNKLRDLDCFNRIILYYFVVGLHFITRFIALLRVISTRHLSSFYTLRPV